MLLEILSMLEEVLWSYIGLPLILFVGLYFTIATKFAPLRRLPAVFKRAYGMSQEKNSNTTGVHPLKALFASLGGALGIGNLVVVCMAVKIGGPGSLVWLWVAGIVGMVLKYAEIYLGHKYRTLQPNGLYTGGPMVYLQKAFNKSWLTKLMCMLMCIYGTEILIFNIIVDVGSQTFALPKEYTTWALLVLLFTVVLGGIQRVANISAYIVPLFVVLFCSMGAWTLFQNLEAIPGVLKLVFQSAFSGHAAVGGFVGASAFSAMVQGVQRACYSADIGIGYASVIHASSNHPNSKEQAELGFVGVVLDNFIVCTLSILLILVTGVWQMDISANFMVEAALGGYFPYMSYFMAFFVGLLGFSTLTAYLQMGFDSARFLSPSKGKWVYGILAAASFIFFANVSTEIAALVMGCSGGALLVCNLLAFVKLKDLILNAK